MVYDMTEAPQDPIQVPAAAPKHPPSSAVARYDGPRNVTELAAYSQLLATNGPNNNRQNAAIPAVFRENPSALAFVVEYARALDIPPVTAMTGVHFIDGKMTASAGLISALVRRAGHQLRGPRLTGTYEAGDLTAHVEITRYDDPEHPYESTWTLQRAARAQLVKLNDNGQYVAVKSRSAWDTYPENMLKARALTECARDAAEDALMGLHYTPEELGADVDANGEIVYSVTQVQNWGAGDRPAAEEKPVEHEPISQPYLDELRQSILDLANLDEARELFARIKASGVFAAPNSWQTTAMPNRDGEASTCQAVFNAEVERLKAGENPDGGTVTQEPSDPPKGPESDNLGLPYEVVRLPNGEVDQVATLRNEVAWKKDRRDRLAEKAVENPNSDAIQAADNAAYEADQATSMLAAKEADDGSTGSAEYGAPPEQSPWPHIAATEAKVRELTARELKTALAYGKLFDLRPLEPSDRGVKQAQVFTDACDRLIAWRPYDPTLYGHPQKDRRIDPDGIMQVPSEMPTQEQIVALGLDAEVIEERPHTQAEQHAAQQRIDREEEAAQHRKDVEETYRGPAITAEAAKIAAREAARNAKGPDTTPN